MNRSKQNSHLDPVKVSFSTSKKIEYAKYKAAIKAAEKRESALEKERIKSEYLPNNHVSKTNKFMLVILVIVVFLLGIVLARPEITENISSSLFRNPNQNAAPKTQTPKPSNQAESNSKSSTSEETPSNSSQDSSKTPESDLVERATQAIYKEYKVTAFSQIKNSENWQVLSSIKEISKTSANLLIVRSGFSYSETSRAALKKAGIALSEILKKELPDFAGLAIISFDNYYYERI